MDAIVVGTDGSPGAEAAVKKVIELAGGSGATIHLVCAYPGKSTLERIGMTARQEPVDLRGVAADLLARDERRLVDAGFTVEKYAREGDPAQTIIDVAGGRQGRPDRHRRAREHRDAALHARRRRGQARAPCAEEPDDRARGLSAAQPRRHR